MAVLEDENQNLSSGLIARKHLLTPVELYLCRGHIDSVMAFLDHNSLAMASFCCKSWNDICMHDNLWYESSKRRWRIPYKLHQKKICGGATWSQVYSNFVCSKRLPKGLFTNKRDVTFAKGRNRGLDMWVTVGHTEDCRVARTITTDEGTRITINAIELRLVVQNIAHRTCRVQPAGARVALRPPRGGGGGMGPVESPVLLRPLGPELLAVDGARVPPGARALAPPPPPRPGGGAGGPLPAPLAAVEVGGSLPEADIAFQCADVVLGPLQFAVIKVYIHCPDCNFEPDFLCRALAVAVPVAVPAPVSPHGACSCHSARRAAQAPRLAAARFLDEGEVWEHYSELPGGCMVLKERNRYEI